MGLASAARTPHERRGWALQPAEANTEHGAGTSPRLHLVNRYTSAARKRQDNDYEYRWQSRLRARPAMRCFRRGSRGENTDCAPAQSHADAAPWGGHRPIAHLLKNHAVAVTQRAGCSGSGDQTNRERIGGVRGRQRRARRRHRVPDRALVTGAYAGAASAGQIFQCSIRTATAAARHAQLELKIFEGRRTAVHARADLTFGDCITYANVHENNYRKLFASAQAPFCDSGVGRTT